MRSILGMIVLCATAFADPKDMSAEQFRDFAKQQLRKAGVRATISYFRSLNDDESIAAEGVGVRVREPADVARAWRGTTGRTRTPPLFRTPALRDHVPGRHREISAA